jgi:hypothetical protein
MSPEQAASEPIDGRSDLFSLGSVLYLLLTGKRAFDAQGVAAILTRVALLDPPLPGRIVPDLPPDLDYVVARALAKAPAFRYPDGRTLAEDLTDIGEARPPRHRSSWTAPARAEGTIVSESTHPEPETTDLRSHTRPTLPGGAPTLREGSRPLLFVGVAGGLALAAGLLLLPGRRPEARPPGPSSPPPADGEAQTQPGPTPEPSESPRVRLWPPAFGLGAPARLDVELEHGVRSGRLRVFVDDEAVLEKELGAPVKKKIVFYKMRKQVLRESLDVRPGEHVVRVQVTMGDDTWSERLKGTFESGRSRKLVANFGGIIGKELELGWGASPSR